MHPRTAVRIFAGKTLAAVFAVSLATAASAYGEYGLDAVQIELGDPGVKFSDLAYPSGGDLYAALSGRGEHVARFSADGEMVSSFAVPDRFPNQYNFMKLDVDGAGNIVVLDETNVWRFSADGTLLAEWQVPSKRAGGGGPTGVATDEVGNVYVAVERFNHPGLLLKYSPDGAEVASWALEGQPTAIDLFGETIYLLLGYKVHRLRLDGRFLSTWQLERPAQDAFDRRDIVAAEGRLFALRFVPSFLSISGGPTPGLAGVQVVGPDGKQTDEFGCYGSGDERLSDSWAISVDPAGRPLIGDGNRVKRFALGLTSPCVVESNSSFSFLRPLGVRWRCPFDACKLEVSGFVETRNVRTKLQPARARLAEDANELVRLRFRSRSDRHRVRNHLEDRSGVLRVRARAHDEGGRSETEVARVPLER